MMKDKYKTLIYSSWAVLIFYCLVKVIFGTDFSLSSSSENFVTISKYIDDHFYLKVMLSCITTLISGYFILCAMTKQKKLLLKDFILYTLLTIVKCVSQWYFNWLGVLLDFVILIGLPILINYRNNIKNKVKYVVIGCVLVLLFQVFAIFLTSISYIDIDTLTTLEALLYNLEFYFLVFLYYLYALKGDK